MKTRAVRNGATLVCFSLKPDMSGRTASGQKLTHAPHRKAQLFVGLPTSANEGYPKKAHSRVLLGDDEMSLRTPARSRFVCEPNHQRQSDEDAERVA